MATLIFRCDADADIGHGHVARCRELARHLGRWQPLFAGHFDQTARSELLAAGLPILARPRLGEDDLSTLRAAAACLPAAAAPGQASMVVLCDSYAFEPRHAAQLQAAGLRWGAFDDYNVFEFRGARLLINFRVGAERWGRYAAEVCLLGVGYMPVSAALVQLRGRRESAADSAEPVSSAAPVPRVLACIGGSDRHGAGRRLVEEFADGRAGSLTLVDVNGEFAGRVPGATTAQPASQAVTIVPRTPDLAQLLAHCDVAVTGGGRIKYEACFLGLPTIVLSQTAAEAEDTALLAGQGLCVPAGNAWELPVGAVSTAIAAGWARRLALRRACFATFPADPTQRLVAAVEAALLSPP